MFKHILFTKFDDRENAKKAKALLEGLKDEIPQIVDVECGLDEVRSARSFDLCMIMTFNSREDFEIYDEAEPHQVVRRFIQSVRTDSATVDFSSSR